MYIIYFRTKATPVSDVSHLPIDRTGTESKMLDASVCSEENGMPVDFVDKMYIGREFKVRI